MEIPTHLRTFWENFLQTDSRGSEALDNFEGSFQIGADKHEADEGARLILSGEKTATSSLLWTLERNQEPLPKVGGLYVVEDGSRAPVCLIETTWVDTIRFGDVEAEFARDYSECDGTLEDWYRVFGAYCRTECTAMNRELTDETPLVCERFRLIYPK